MKNADDIKEYQKATQRQRVHIFLVGLDGIFEQICGEILRKEPVLDLEDCYALVRREAVHHSTLNSGYENSESSVMVA